MHVAAVSHPGIAFRRGARLALITTAFGAAGGAAQAIQLAAVVPATEQPSAQELIRRYVQVTGLAAMTDRGAMQASGRFSMPAMGASGALVMVQIKPNRMAMRMTLPGLGDIRSGFDGEVGWSINPMEGPRVMSGAELVQVKDEADFGAATRDARLLASAETVGREEFDGRACWKVKLGWRSGRESFDCYDVESGLLIATVQQNATGMGPVESVTIFSDYRDFDGIRMPAVTTQKAFNQQLVFTIEKVTWGSVDPAEVALPDAIVALLGRK